MIRRAYYICHLATTERGTPAAAPTGSGSDRAGRWSCLASARDSVAGARGVLRVLGAGGSFEGLRKTRFARVWCAFCSIGSQRRWPFWDLYGCACLLIGSSERKVSKLLSEDQLNSRNSVNFGGASGPIAKDISMRRHETQVCVALALLFLVSMAVGLHAWL